MLASSAPRHQGDADAGADAYGTIFQVHWRVQPFQQTFGQVVRIFGRLHALADHHELVTAEALRQIGIAHVLPQALRHFGQCQVAVAVAVLVVDRFETVKVDQHHGEQFVAALAARQCLLQVLL